MSDLKKELWELFEKVNPDLIEYFPQSAEEVVNEAKEMIDLYEKGEISFLARNFDTKLLSSGSTVKKLFEKYEGIKIDKWTGIPKEKDRKELEEILKENYKKLTLF